MPCLYSNIECFRVQAVIPGFDAPVLIPRGRYSASLELSWHSASGEGSLKLKLGIVRENAEIVKVGTRPDNTTGWRPFEGSTKTYSALIEPRAADIGGGLYAVHVWIWVYTPLNGTDVERASIIIEDVSSGRQIQNVTVQLDRAGIYREALIRIVAPRGRYIIKIVLGLDITMHTELDTEAA